MKKRFKNIGQVWEAVESGKKVNWINSLYQVVVESNNDGARWLSVRCIENWFGSKLTKEEIPELYAEVSE